MKAAKFESHFVAFLDVKDFAFHEACMLPITETCTVPFPVEFLLDTKQIMKKVGFQWYDGYGVSYRRKRVRKTLPYKISPSSSLSRSRTVISEGDHDCVACVTNKQVFCTQLVAYV